LYPLGQRLPTEGGSVGTFFLFVNRRRDRLKLLYRDRGDGLAIWYKRLEVSSFQLPSAPCDAVSMEMTTTQLTLILSGIDLRSARQRKRYQRPTPVAQKIGRCALVALYVGAIIHAMIALESWPTDPRECHGLLDRFAQ
jgi:hypothetical protein